MTRPQTLFIATGNAHKVKEISELLGGDIQCISMKSLDNPPSLIEDGDTFKANALAKAEQLSSWLIKSGVGKGACMTLADDSGLEVDALDGAPGVYSARFAADETAAAGNAPDETNNAKLIRLIKDVPDARRTARFRCVLALVQAAPDGSVAESWTFDGRCEGILGHALSGAHGFGYDPLFRPLGYDQTFAELGSDIKNKISHRSRALEKLQSFLNA